MVGKNGAGVTVNSIIIHNHLDKDGNEIYKLDEGVELQADEHLLYPTQSAILTPGQRIKVRLTMKHHRLRKGMLYTI